MVMSITQSTGPVAGVKLSGSINLRAISSNHRCSVVARSTAPPCCRLCQDADDGVTLLVLAGNFRTIAKTIGAHATRVVMSETRQALVMAGGAHQFCKNGAPSVR